MMSIIHFSIIFAVIYFISQKLEIHWKRPTYALASIIGLVWTSMAVRGDASITFSSLLFDFEAYESILVVSLVDGFYMIDGASISLPSMGLIKLYKVLAVVFSVIALYNISNVVFALISKAHIGLYKGLLKYYLVKDQVKGFDFYALKNDIVSWAKSVDRNALIVHGLVYTTVASVIVYNVYATIIFEPVQHSWLDTILFWR